MFKAQQIRSSFARFQLKPPDLVAAVARRLLRDPITEGSGSVPLPDGGARWARAEDSADAGPGVLMGNPELL